jgi:AcrR family transcriptional regulator
VTTQPKQDRSRVTRQRMLEAAVHCLATKGWDASTVAVIAAEAGISRGAVQYHFPTRENLVVAALEFMFEERTTLVREFVVTPDTSATRVHRVVSALVDLYAGELFRAALQVWAAAASDPHLRDVVVPLERRFGRDMHDLAARLLQIDAEDQQARGLIQATLDLARGLALADLLTDDSKRRAGVVDAWAGQLANGLAAPPPER